MTENTAATATTIPQPLTYPRATFAKLSPRPFLLAHLQPPPSSSSSSPTAVVRPSGRQVSECRPPIVQTGSLTYTDGSAVVRFGDTAVVCGIKAEVLLASDVPTSHSSSSSIAQSTTTSRSHQDDIRSKGLLVPNVELSTGCSPDHLPGQPPSTLAQSLAVRVLSLLHCSNIVSDEDLQIWHQPPSASSSWTADEVDGPSSSSSPPELKAFWTLYLDILFISLDGNAFDSAWASVRAALADLRLPSAHWDVDDGMVRCDNDSAKAKPLRLNGAPFPLTLAVFTTRRPGTPGKGSDWILADPDAFEEQQCHETVTVTVDATDPKPPIRLLKLEKSGGGVVSREHVRHLVDLAHQRWTQWQHVLDASLDQAVIGRTY